jgi:hypothetical protein
VQLGDLLRITSLGVDVTNGNEAYVDSHERKVVPGQRGAGT